jgi:MFS superfamily sulfate permease-like transporter
MLALLTGGLCIFAGLARFGFITDLLSKPVRLGYLNGIALTVIIGQLPKLLGFSSSGDNLIQEAISLVQTEHCTLAEKRSRIMHEHEVDCA